MYIYRKSIFQSVFSRNWNRIFIADIEYAIALALNSKDYSIK